jgi:pilus assembly protein CpaE
VTKPENIISFSSNRTFVMPAAKLPRAVVLGTTNGLAEKVAQGLNDEGATQASALTMSLSEFVNMPDLSMSDLAICLFEIVKGDDKQIEAIRTLRAMGHEGLNIIGLTSEVLTSVTTRQYLEAGVQDVVPLVAVSSELNHDAAPAYVADKVAVEPGGSSERVRGRNGMIIGVAQTRGGIGATTFALNLATMLSVKPKQRRNAVVVQPPRVAVVDLDLQNGTLGASIDVIEKTAFIEMLRSGAKPDAAMIENSMVSHNTGFDVLPAPVEFVPLDCMSSDMMAALLDELRTAYDYVVLDMPRMMVEWLDPLLARADKIYLLSDTAVHSVRQARRMIDFYCEDHVALPLDVVVSLERKPFIPSAAMKEAEKFLSRKLTHWVPRDDRAAKLATDRGQTLIATKPKSPVKKSMEPMILDLASYFAADKRREA